MKYARFVAVGAETRTIDVIDLAEAAYATRPLLGCTTDEELLAKLFQPNQTAWTGAGQWFHEVPQLVQDGSVYSGTDYMDGTAYVNPDNTDGNGTPLPPPDQSE